jgi:hypothetical protein
MRLPVVLASLAALIGLAVPAHADPGPDAGFLDALNNAGITYHNGPDANRHRSTGMPVDGPGSPGT